MKKAGLIVALVCLLAPVVRCEEAHTEGVVGGEGVKGNFSFDELDGHHIICEMIKIVDLEKKEFSAVECAGEEFELEETIIKAGTPKFWTYVIVCTIFVCTAGMVSGLQLGLLSLDQNMLNVLVNAGDGKEAKNAKAILPLVQRHHLLMVTLLVVNASCMEALPLFLDRLMSPYAAIIVSVTLVLLFGEIFPQAVCSRYGLAIGSTLSPIVWGFIFLTFVISWPISLVLDAMLGEDHGAYYRRGELRELVGMQKNNQDHDGLDDGEIKIIQCALEMKGNTVGELITPIDTVFMLDFTGKITRDTLTKINMLGHSRIPIFRGDRNNVIGMILTKQLILLDPEDDTPIAELEIRRMPVMHSDLPLYDGLQVFQKGQCHMGLVMNKDDCMTIEGVVTMENVIEAILGVDIEDEYDKEGRVAGAIAHINPYASAHVHHTPNKRQSTTVDINDFTAPPTGNDKASLLNSH